MPVRPFAVLNDWDIAVPHPHPDDSSTPHPDDSSTPHPDECSTPHPDDSSTPHPDNSSTPRPSTVPNAFSAIEVLRVFIAADVPRFAPADVRYFSTAAEFLRHSPAPDVPRCSTAPGVLPASPIIEPCDGSPIIEPCDASPNIASCDAKSSWGADTDPRFHHDRPAPVYHHDRPPSVYHHDLEALIWIFVWVVCCYDGGLVGCHDGGLADCHDGGLAVDCHNGGLAVDCHTGGLVDCSNGGLVDCHDAGLVDCHNGRRPRLDPLPQPFAEWRLRSDSRELLASVDSRELVASAEPHELLASVDSHELVANADSRELLASVRRCLKSKKSFLSTVTIWDGCRPAAVWDGCEPAAVWGAPTPTWGAQTPLWRAPTPTWGAPTPTWGAPTPMWGAPTPMWGASTPLWRAPTPIWGAPTPMWRAPSPTWAAPIPIRDLFFAMPAKPSTIWTAASAMWEIAGPGSTPTDQLGVAVTPSALALRMLSYATGYIGERSLAFARPRCMEDRRPRPNREACSEKNAEGDLRSHYVNDASGMARKDDALSKTLADDPGKVWNDFEEIISKCVMVQDDSFRGVLNDWDLADDPSDLRAPTARTTPLMPFGSPPFMAVDMLEEDALKGKVQRLYRHDLESLFYVLTWAACCYTDGRLDPLPRMFEMWALGGLSIRPREFMARLLAYEDPHPLQTCRNSKFCFMIGEHHWPRDILPTGAWREAGYIAQWLRFFFMRDETVRRAVRDWPAERAIRMEEIMALSEGREPPPRPREVDEPEKMWAGFCAAVKEVIEFMVSHSNNR